MQPSVVLGGEHQPVISRPKQLRVGAERIEHTPGTARSPVHLHSTAVGDRRDTDRPRFAGSVRPDTYVIVSEGQTQERNTGAVRRPAWLEVIAETGVDPAQRLIGERVHTDEAVVTTVTDERELGAVRRKT